MDDVDGGRVVGEISGARRDVAAATYFFGASRRVWRRVRRRPGEGVAAGFTAGLEEEAQIADCLMDKAEVVCHFLGGKDVVPILAIREVIIRQIRAGEDQLVVDAVELHMLQAPPLVDSLGYQGLAYSCEIRRVVHADLDLVGELCHQGCEERGA